jgi:hypothetical protein
VLTGDIVVESVLEDDVTLEGWDDCDPFTTSTDAFYNSTEFAAKQAEATPFLNALKPYLDGRSVALKNMVGRCLSVVAPSSLALHSGT